MIWLAGRELKRLWGLNRESRERNENARYLRMDFIVPVGALAVLWVIATGVLLFK